MQRLLLTSFIFILSQSSFAEFRCFKPGKIAHIENNELIKTPKNFCINHSDYSLISYDCIRSDQCQAIKSYKNTRNLRVRNQIGSPHHHKCYLLGGNPRLITYFDGEDWQETGICEFQDKSFISVFNQL